MKPLLFASLALIFVGCAATPDIPSLAGLYSSDPRADAAMSYTGINDGRVHTPEIVYSLALDRNGTFTTSRRRMVDGIPLLDSSFHAGGYDPHEVLRGTWRIAGERLVLQSGDKQYDARLERAQGGWRILWDSIEYGKKPDRAPEPTPASVASPAAQGTPAQVVDHR